jgi:hypothetical protein
MNYTCHEEADEISGYHPVFYSAFTASIRLPAYCARLPASDRHASLPDSPIGGAAYAHSRA